jgi:hypothetical protein
LGRLAEAETYLAESQVDLGRPEFGSHNWRWSLRLADACARLELARGDLDAAAKSTASLLEQAEQREARKYTARGLALRARIHLAGGSFAEGSFAEGTFTDAEAGLQDALRLADSLCYLPTRVEARLRLSHLYRQIGLVDLAEGRLAEASGLIAALDGQIQSPELRLSFERGIGGGLDGREK